MCAYIGFPLFVPFEIIFYIKGNFVGVCRFISADGVCLIRLFLFIRRVHKCMLGFGAERMVEIVSSEFDEMGVGWMKVEVRC